MSKHYLFLLHGMGNQEPGWSKPYAKILEQKAKDYSGKPFTELRKSVEIVELEYGSLLRSIMEDLLEGGSSLGPANDWLRGDSGSGLAKFMRESALDVTAYIWHSDTAVFVLNRLAKTLVRKIKPSPIKNRFSLLCHSLGTKVGFDLLHLLYTEDGNSQGDAPDLDELTPLFKLLPNLSPQQLSPRFSNLYLIANVMPLLNAADLQEWWASESHVRVQRSGVPFQGGVISNNYRIFNNHYDPFSRVGRTHHIKGSVYTNHVLLAQAHEWNMHSLTHYLNHPLVHIPIIQDLYGFEVPEAARHVREYVEAHHDPAIEIPLDTALSLTHEFDGVNPKQLADYLRELAELLPDVPGV